MTDAEKNKAARVFARQVYPANGANCNHADILAAVSALDDTFEGTVAGLPGTAGQSIAVRFNLALPEPFQSLATTAQKATLLAIWSGVKYGYITGGGD